jgi:hypothetical protein
MDLLTVLSQEEVALMPTSLTPVLAVILDPQSSSQRRIQALRTFDANPPSNPLLDHGLPFYILRRCPFRGSLEDSDCLEMLKIIADKFPDSLMKSANNSACTIESFVKYQTGWNQ